MSFRPLLAALVLIFAAPTGRAATIEAGAFFFDAPTFLGGYNQSTVSTAGPVSASSSDTGTRTTLSGPVTNSIDGRARASTTSLGIEMDTDLGGSVAASVWEGVRFITPALASRANTVQSYSIGLVGSLDVEVQQAERFTGGATPLPAGRRLYGDSGVSLLTFQEVDERAAAVRRQTSTTVQELVRIDTAGQQVLSYTVDAPNPTRESEIDVLVARAYRLAVQRCRLAQQACVFTGQPGPAILEQFQVMSFGLGVTLTGTLRDEGGTTGSIRAFNSFDLDGLIMFDADGTIIPGYFVTDSGVDLTLAQFAPEVPGAAPAVPLPGGAALLPLALAGLALVRRRDRSSL